MNEAYRTIQGDTWDMIAKKFTVMKNTWTI